MGPLLPPEGQIDHRAACLAQALSAVERLEVVSARILAGTGTTPCTGADALDALTAWLASVPAAAGRFSIINYWRSRLEAARALRDEVVEVSLPMAGAARRELSAGALAEAAYMLEGVRRLSEDLLRAAVVGATRS